MLHFPEALILRSSLLVFHFIPNCNSLWDCHHMTNFETKKSESPTMSLVFHPNRINRAEETASIHDDFLFDKDIVSLPTDVHAHSQFFFCSVPVHF